MPKFTFECESCAVRFDRTLKMGEHDSHPCPSCNMSASRVWEDFGFGFSTNPNASTANTGVHRDDYPTADRAVGKSAAERWAQYNDRKKVKDRVRELGGGHAIMRVDGEGYVDYEPMTKAGLEANKKVRGVLKDLVPESSTPDKTPQ